MKGVIVVILVIASTALVHSSPDPKGPRRISIHIDSSRPRSPRIRSGRSADPEPQESLSVNLRKNLYRPFPGIRDQRRPPIYVNRLPSPKFRVGRSANPEPQGSLSASWQKNLNGPERRPSINLDYQHKLYENKHGTISASAGASKSPGQRWQPNVGIRGSWRFRRSLESEAGKEIDQQE